jgi:hypothetical protein
LRVADLVQQSAALEDECLDCIPDLRAFVGAPVVLHALVMLGQRCGTQSDPRQHQGRNAKPQLDDGPAHRQQRDDDGEQAVDGRDHSPGQADIVAPHLRKPEPNRNVAR